ncbi:MAG: hypothetical protein WAX89_03510 [Alphaproteobacteria bacterium]
MTHVLLALAFLWLHRWRLLLPVMVCVVVVGAWSLSRPVLYTATATLQLNVESARSPLLQNITQGGHVEVLQAVLRSETLLHDVQAETGMVLNPAALTLEAVNNQLLRLTYRSVAREGLEEALDTLALQFIHELLSPERFRTEQQVQTLEKQMHDYKTQLTSVDEELALQQQALVPEAADARDRAQSRRIALDFQKERLTTQLKLVRQEYETLLKSMQTLTPQGFGDSMSGVLWFAEPTSVSDPIDSLLQHWRRIKSAAFWGVLFGVMLVLFRRYTDTSVRHDDEMQSLTGLRIVGRLPNFGVLEMGRDGPVIRPATSSTPAKGTRA